MLKFNMRWVTETAKNTTLLWDVLDALNLPAFSINKELKITDANEVVNQRLLFHKDDVPGTGIFEIVEVARPEKDSLANEETTVYEGRCLQKNRESFPARFTFVKQPDGFIVVIEDLSSITKISRRAAQRSREINTYNALSKTLSSTPNLNELARGVLETLVTVMRIDAAWLYLMDNLSGELNLWNFQGVDEKIFEAARHLKPYECFIGRVMSSGKALLVKNASEDPRITHLKIAESGFTSIAGVPLSVKNIDNPGGRAIGVLGVASRDKDYFNSLDMQFLSSVGNQLGVAIDNTRLIEDLRDKMRQIELINEISGLVNSSLSIGHIFRLVVSEIKKIISFDRASINLLEEDKDILKIFALDTERPTRLKKGIMAPLKGTSSGWVTQNQEPWINRDLRKEMPFIHDAVLLEEGIRSTISIPLFKDRPLGALNLDSIDPGHYSEKDLEILLPVAKNLSIALENALLFEEISKEKRAWEKTFDAITDMVWIENQHGKVLRVNRTVLEHSGRPELSLIHKSSGEIFSVLKIINGAKMENRQVHEKKRLYKELRGRDGNTYHFWAYPLVDSDGNVYGAVNYLRNVTEQKRLEHQLLRTDKLAALGTLVAGIAHEINNPLGIIAGYSEALLDRANDPELMKLGAFEDFQEYLETINKEIFRCKDILKSLLEFARPSSGTYREIDINALIKEVILLVKHKASKQKHTLELRLSEWLPETSAEPGALRQLFINIIVNSMSFMGDEGKIIITTKHEKGGPGKGVIRISIADNGKWIESGTTDKIFDPFFTTKPVGKGTGLGLSISHRIVSEHEGTIEAENNDQGGTTFHIKIPVREKKIQ
ncbi:sensor protein ZraS [bacterium BMS3Abin07]|nr:sensor protein ZraS [bacterium BMS3Abin07]GBE31608.1 sensor protein ZraS [bacterium BMS3Bbin05]HDO21720.1 GAF domain-containing protein [Nitrospirota bacterium]HDZ87075.1 GAF domain-containing protein [Nitrospirota bacterium]